MTVRPALSLEEPIMARPDAIINITNLRLRTFIGFNDEERKKKQNCLV